MTGIRSAVAAAHGAGGGDGVADPRPAGATATASLEPTPTTATAPRLRRLRSVLTVRPFEQDTPGGRSKERYRRAALSATTGGLVRLVGLVGVVITVPLTLGYLGQERYGLWVTVASLAAVLQFSDLGLGNGVVTMIAELQGSDSRDRIRVLVSSALALLVASGAAVLALAALAARFVDWPRLFHLSEQVGHEAAPAVAVYLACLGLGVPLGLVTHVQNGLQEGFVANLWAAAGAAVGLGAVVVAALLEAPVLGLVAAGAVPPLVALAVNSVHFFGLRHPDLRPSLASVRLATSMSLLRLGGLFFVLQVAVAVAYSSDNLVIGAVRGAEEVTAYSVPFRLFAFFPMVVALVVSPLWPAYGEAIARRDLGWVRRTLSRSLAAVAGVTVPCCVLLIVAGPQLVEVWTAGRVHAGRFLLAGLALWAVLGSLGGAAAMLLNAARQVRLQVVTAVVMAVANVALTIVFVRAIGPAGAVWATLVSYVVCVVVPFAVRIPRLLDRLGVDADPAA